MSDRQQETTRLRCNQDTELIYKTVRYSTAENESYNNKLYKKLDFHLFRLKSSSSIKHQLAAMSKCEN